MNEYLSKMKLIHATKKYSLYLNEDTEELVIYNGFSTFAFELDVLGRDIYKGAHNPREIE